MSECQHYEREEIDFHLIMVGRLKKLVRCKDCEEWLYEALVREP